EIAPDDNLVKQHRALELAVERQLADQREAIWLDLLEQLVETGDWERVRALMQAARAQLERNAQRAEQAEHSPPRAEAESDGPAASALSAPVVEAEPETPTDIARTAQEAWPDIIELPRATEPPAVKSPPTVELPEARPRTIIGMSAAAVVLLLLAAVAMPGRKVSVAFDHVPEGAALLVDGQPVSDASFMLGPGVHRWSITAPGYEPDSGSFQVDRDSVRVPLELSPRRATPPRPKPAPPPSPAYGSVMVVTPGQNDVAVHIDRTQVGRTAGSSLLIDSLAPGQHTISLEKEGFCLSEARPRGINIAAGEQRTDTFSLKRWPRLLVNSSVRNAQFTVMGEKSGPRRAGEAVSVEPGTHRYTVTAAQHHDSTATVALECGQNRSISVPLRPMAGTRNTVAVAGWPRDCFERQDGWQKAARECFHNDGSAVRKYQFEVRRVKSGGAVYGPWLVGTRGAFVECKIEGGEFRWRVSGRGNWQSAALQLPKDASRLFVRVSAGSDAATLEIGADAKLKNAQRLRVRAGGGFGVKKDAQIREFRRG
ncbi:MAG TPA: hypothetical protein VK864_09390, partial [Longimicrobiales bacterium]|nr:hypothetical protein [Longimicrobiales bacterium]